MHAINRMAIQGVDVACPLQARIELAEGGGLRADRPLDHREQIGSEGGIGLEAENT